MVLLQLQTDAVCFGGFAVFLAAFPLGGLIHPALGNLALFLPQGGGKDQFFANGATATYTAVCFFHFGGMAAGLTTLAVGLIARINGVDEHFLSYGIAIGAPIAWALGFGVQTLLLFTEHGWRGVETLPEGMLVWVVAMLVGTSVFVALAIVAGRALVQASQK